jgi:hypothetical protein
MREGWVKFSGGNLKVNQFKYTSQVLR